MRLWLYGGKAHSSGRQNEIWLPARWRGGGIGGWEGDETRCEEGAKERRKLTQLTVVAEAAAVLSVCVCAGQPSRRTEGGRMWPDKMERDRSVRKKRKLEREVEEEILVPLAQALLSGFGLAHEAAVADCCCLAVCCSDMQDYTMCSQREREREREREPEREIQRQREMKGRAGVRLKG